MKHFANTYLRQKRKRLMRQLQQLEELMLRGSLIERYKQCGKSNCHCVNGEGHGPTYYLSVTIPEQGSVMVYIPGEHKAIIEKALKNYRDTQNILQEISNINRELLLRKVFF
jgi:hypothetical protein